MKKIITAFLFVAVLSGLSLAAAFDFNRCFHSMDKDGDERVTAQELDAAYPGGSSEILKAADTDKDGSLDHDEWETFKAHHGIEDSH